MEQAEGRWWFKYNLEFKRQAVDRMMAGESVTVLAKELGVRRKFFYAWREAGFGSAGPQPPILLRRQLAKERQQEGEQAERKQAPTGAGERQASSLRKRVSELEQLVGRQAAELDFFVAALRSIEELGPTSGADSGNESTPRSKPQRKAR